VASYIAPEFRGLNFEWLLPRVGLFNPVRRCFAALISGSLQSGKAASRFPAIIAYLPLSGPKAGGTIFLAQLQQEQFKAKRGSS
jgi:hypothetical protein